MRLSTSFMRAGLAVTFCLLALVEIVGVPNASAAPYPSRRITLVVPFPAGSATDAVTRRLAESIGGATNAAVIVENKPVPMATWQRYPS
jgi:tripartite-type tricarboxylate transporter receptor subunit TctC